MEVAIESLKEEELNDFIRTFWAAFEPISANMIMPMIYRNGLQDDLIERFRYRIRRQTGGDLAKYCFTAKDTNTGEIIGVSWWAMIENPSRTKDEIDQAFEEDSKARAKEPPVEGIHGELNDAFFKVAYYSEMETVAGRPYMCLRMLAVHPNYHRRGAGSLLLTHGLEEADKLGLPVYLDCGVMGKPMYEKYGFENVGDFPLNCLDYGGRSDGRHWLMLRPARDATE